jgi:DNA-binding NarL/FixJ family response regulator
MLKFLDSTSPENFGDYRILFNHRYINRSGGISQFLHEGNLSYNENTDEIAFNLKVFSEIGDIKSDDSVVLTIFRYSVATGFQKIFNKEYKSIQDSVLTSRELEVVKLCQQGLSSKMIADKLALSIHTVKNHKRNIMGKTMTHNITELLHRCTQNQWI